MGGDNSRISLSAKLMRKVPFVAIAGNIGCGKTTLARLLSNRLGWSHYEEPVEDNPFLPRFYEEVRNGIRPSDAAAKVQKYFLLYRAMTHMRISALGKPVIQDRTIYEDREVFARNLYEVGFLSEEVYEEYSAVYDFSIRDLPLPTLMVFLEAPLPVLRKRILARGRPYEISMADPAEPYLGQLKRLYDRWMGNWSDSELVRIDSAERNFLDHADTQAHIVQLIEDRLGSRPQSLFDA
ncbi:deoxynucleoside kinase [bacterium]|nr:deoxynucleoside kinase [bacterium]